MSVFTDIANFLFGGKNLAIGPVSVTPAQAASYLDMFAGGFSRLSADIKAHNWDDGEVVVADDILKIASSGPLNAVEGPFALPIDVAATVLPWVFDQGAKHLNDYTLTGPITPNTYSPDSNTAGPGGIWPTTIGNQQ
jgi:hypothetical protein